MSMELSFKEKMIQGRIGKRYVIKHYKTYKVKTKVPDMSNIIPSRGQKRQRRLFRLAVQYAQEIYWNPVKREEKERIYRRPWRLFQKLMKEWFKKRKAKREAAQRRLKIWRRNVMLTGERLNVIIKQHAPNYKLRQGNSCNRAYYNKELVSHK
ncbi:MAG TPA: hypothetical protein VHK91_08590 [Flavisolibacter sp.]|jgi:hypothetical protein|nr:hypothetical protein [Flavisolibacter sp.]